MTNRDRATSARRLLKLADHLRMVKPEQFDYRSIVDISDAAYAGFVYDSSPYRKQLAASRITCGATACAIGHAATVPEFKRLGLKIKGFNVRLGRKENFAAMREVFILTRDESLHLFDPFEGRHVEMGRVPPESASPRQVAVHIEKFVRNHRKPMKESK